jgi:tetratricopeptide (TPR) repeat protein
MARDAKPFAVLMGAGTSKSAGIPLARELVAEINAKPEFKRHLDHKNLSEKECEDYGLCMGALIPSIRHRLLDPYLKPKEPKVNWSNLGIAALLKSEHIKRVLTFNFDDVLQRAGGMLGLYPPIYDYSINPPEDVGHLANKAVIHLHGQGAGLVMLNSKHQTTAHAKKLRPLLRDTLANYHLIVVGYSGEADQCFDELNDIYAGTNHLFWLSYDEDIKSHLAAFEGKGSGSFNLIGGVDSDRFMIELGQELASWPPKILQSPEEHLLEELKPVIPYPKDIPGDDLLAKMRTDLVRRAKERRDVASRFGKLLLQGRYEELVQQKDKAVSDDDKKAVAWAHTMQGNALSDLAKQENSKELYEQSFAKYAEAIRIKPDMHEALYNWGSALLSLYGITNDTALLEKAEELTRKAEQFSGRATYNFACVLARREQEEECRQQLLRCKADGTLPSKDHLLADDDLAAYRDREWFRKMLEV